MPDFVSLVWRVSFLYLIYLLATLPNMMITGIAISRTKTVCPDEAVEASEVAVGVAVLVPTLLRLEDVIVPVDGSVALANSSATPILETTV